MSQDFVPSPGELGEQALASALAQFPEIAADILDSCVMGLTVGVIVVAIRDQAAIDRLKESGGLPGFEKAIWDYLGAHYKGERMRAYFSVDFVDMTQVLGRARDLRDYCHSPYFN